MKRLTAARKRMVGPVAGLFAVSLLAGCASSQQDPVRATADRFYAAIADGDGQAACAVLAPTVRSEIEESAGSPCSQAILDEDVPDASVPTRVSVYGTSAQVRYDGESAFLSRFEDGWRVIAAACRPGPVRYDCRIQGA
ncbi:MAG: hypothetical protein M3499_01730 [Actinomycetota bacterium]|nr:hypothetical protein [Actinomycetota bacterium]